MEKTCSWCGKKITNTYSQEYCGPQCQFAHETANPKHSKGKRRIPYHGTATCKECEKEFVHYYGDRGFCSVICKKAVAVRTAQRNQGSRYKIIQRDGFSCAYCGASPCDGSGTKLAVDHIVPAVSGGESRAYNLITACMSCNASKSQKRLPKGLEDKMLELAMQRSLSVNMDPKCRIPMGERYHTEIEKTPLRKWTAEEYQQAYAASRAEVTCS